MRMGKLNVQERHLRTTPPKKKPKYSSPTLVPGQVSSNLIASIYTPIFIELANECLENYADALLHYDDALQAIQKTNSTDDAAVDTNGNVVMTDVPVPPVPPLFRSQHMIDELMDVMTDTSKHFAGPKAEWKIYANAAKFERRLDEKYGIFRPFITNHPEVELFVKSMQRKYAMGYFSPLRQGPPPIPRTTAIIILFMMQRNKVRWEILTLASLFFLIGLQPWVLVALVILAHSALNKRKKKLVGGMNPKRVPVEPYYLADSKDGAVIGDDAHKRALLLKPVGIKYDEKVEINMSEFDTFIIGSGPGALYTASLLSRAGRTVLVLSPEDDASGCLTLENCKKPDLVKKYRSVPFDVESCNVARISRQQEIMAPALCTSNDYQGGIRFAQIGTEADGYAFEILSIPGMGTDGGREEVPFILKARGGVSGLMDDAATYLGDGWPGFDDGIGNSLSGAYLQACAGMNASAGEFFLSKVLSDKVNDFRSKSTYQESAIRYTSSFLERCFPLNVHLRSLMAGIGMKGEDIKPSQTSMGSHVSNVCAAMSGEGMHYPIGGPRALCLALASSVEQCGGRVLTGIQVKEFLFKEAEKKDVSKKEKKTEEGEEKDADNPRCIGVKLTDGRELKFSTPKLDDDVRPTAIISMQGFVHTFIRLMPDVIRTTYKTPRGLPALTEQRPVFKILVGLKGSAEDLNVTGADFYRLPSAALAIDEVDPDTGTVRYGEIGGEEKGNEVDEKAGSDEVAVDDVNAAPLEGKEIGVMPSKPKKSQKVKFNTGSSWIKISFPSAKDPTFSARHGTDVTTCVITIEADDDFVLQFDTKPKLYSIFKDRAGIAELRQRLLDRVIKDLLEIFPQIEGNVEHAEVRGPFYRGLSHNPERYAAKGVRSDTPFPGLFMGGSDLTVGDSFAGSIVSGWLAANAVVGYSAVDHLFLKKNITSDLEQFMPLPEHETTEDDIAVPFVPKAAEQDETVHHEDDKDLDEQ